MNYYVKNTICGERVVLETGGVLIIDGLTLLQGLEICRLLNSFLQGFQ